MTISQTFSGFTDVRIKIDNGKERFTTTYEISNCRYHYVYVKCKENEDCEAEKLAQKHVTRIQVSPEFFSF